MGDFDCACTGLRANATLACVAPNAGGVDCPWSVDTLGRWIPRRETPSANQRAPPAVKRQPVGTSSSLLIPFPRSPNASVFPPAAGTTRPRRCDSIKARGSREVLESQHAFADRHAQSTDSRDTSMYLDFRVDIGYHCVRWGLPVTAAPPPGARGSPASREDATRVCRR